MINDPIMSNANKLNIHRLSALLFKKGFTVSKSYDTYKTRRRTFLLAWKEGDARYALRFRDWTTEIELTPQNQRFPRVFADETITQDITIARMLVKECWEE